MYHLSFSETEIKQIVNTTLPLIVLIFTPAIKMTSKFSEGTLFLALYLYWWMLYVFKNYMYQTNYRDLHLPLLADFQTGKFITPAPYCPSQSRAITLLFYFKKILGITFMYARFINTSHVFY